MKIIIDEQSEGERIDLYLAEFMQDISRSKIQNLIKTEEITLNNSQIKPSYVLKQDDIIEFEESTISNTKTLCPEPENIPLEIVWEDENMAVINKPSGMLTHPTTKEMSGTLVNALLYKYGKDGLSDLNGEMRRGIVHRLGRNTSGLIMIAKNNKTHEFLTEEMKSKNFCKIYCAIVRGIIDEDSFIISTPIGRHPTKPEKMAVNGKDAKDSVSEIKVLKRYKENTLIEVKLVTGRTHQIRVHLSSIGHPVYNDTLYGFGKPKIKTQEQVLQSYKLEFTKPFTSERISLEIPLDDEFQRVIKFLLG